MWAEIMKIVSILSEDLYKLMLTVVRSSNIYSNILLHTYNVLCNMIILQQSVHHSQSQLL